MSNKKYFDIFQDLKDQILSERIADKKLPSEIQLSKQYEVSRNTIRRAIELLASEGLVTSIQGKGVFIIKNKPLEFSLEGINSFKKISKKNSLDFKTIVPYFEEIIINDEEAKKTSLEKGSRAYKLLRVRQLDGENIILDINYYLWDKVKGLTPEIASDSIYDYIENVLELKISSSRKNISIKPITKLDKENLTLKDYNLVAVIKRFVYLDDGTLFEYTESHHRPDHFNITNFSRRIY